jgi:methionine synthase II (cobalamin-independent)
MTGINEDTTIEEIVREYPELIRPLMQHGIKCVMCGEPIWGTLKENAQEKGINNLSEILVELNSIIAKAHRKVI